MADKKYNRTLRNAQRLEDMLEANIPMWQIEKILDQSEKLLRKRYLDVFAKYPGKDGPRPWEPTPTEIRQIEIMAGIGIKMQDIALVIGCSKYQLEKNCANVIARAKVVAHMRVGGNILKMATGDPEHKNTALMAALYAKTQMGWQERDRMEITGSGGGPVQSQVQIFLPDNGRGGPMIEGSPTIDGDMDVDGGDDNDHDADIDGHGQTN